MHIKTETTVGIFILASIGAFLYMTFQIGVFRLDKAKYAHYIAPFTDVAGLTKKAEVKIAGVKVGWVESIELAQDGQVVQAHIMILKEYILHPDGIAIVRQEGLLGTKYLELVPGNPLGPSLLQGQPLSMQTSRSATMDELMVDFQRIANNLEQVSSCIKDSFKETSSEIRAMIESLREKLPNLADSITRLSDNLHVDMLPKVTQEIKHISQTLDTVNRIAATCDSACGNFNQITCKINEGEGLIGKLINDSQAYNDLCSTVKSVKSSFSKFDNIVFTVDGWLEYMFDSGQNRNCPNSKAWVYARLYPCQDYFYLGGATFSQRGYVTRKMVNYEYFDERNRPLLPNQKKFTEIASCAQISKEKRDDFRFNFQIGKVFNNIAFRLGLIESTAGIGIDYRIPFQNENLKWIMTFEAWDFRGYNRWFKDDRPHLKWLNKIYVTPNIYLAFGADDFISKYNKSAFIGAGIRFADDDIKYVISNFSCLP